MGTFETVGSGDLTTRAYVAGEAGSGGPAVVVFHPWWGLNDDVVTYADRLADAGFTVLAPDLYQGSIATSIDEADKLSSALDTDLANGLALAAVDHLAGRLEPGRRFAAVGFSMGAAWSIWSPAERDVVAASVVYYGTVMGPSLGRASVPVLGHFAETDPYELPDWVTEFENALRAHGRDVTIHRYPGTGHWFAEPSNEAYDATAADLAFGRTTEFLRRHLDPAHRADR
ncbi:MAG: dienelactone hydrolase family protein [Chloroflexota bacterium]